MRIELKVGGAVDDPSIEATLATVYQKQIFFNADIGDEIAKNYAELHGRLEYGLETSKHPFFFRLGYCLGYALAHIATPDLRPENIQFDDVMYHAEILRTSGASLDPVNCIKEQIRSWPVVLPLLDEVFAYHRDRIAQDIVENDAYHKFNLASTRAIQYTEYAYGFIDSYILLEGVRITQEVNQRLPQSRNRFNRS